MDSESETTATAGRFSRRKVLRQATFILPSTGERVKRDVTLRDPAIYGSAPNNIHSTNEQTPLLPKTSGPPAAQTRIARLKQWIKDSAAQFIEFSKSVTAHDVFKCSLAYLIATLATFSVPVAAVLGTHQDGNQLVANIVVWFDPARSAGSMLQGILLAFLAFLYGAVVAFGSQAVSAFFTSQDLVVVGHVMVLLVFCWGGLGFLAWFKQHSGHPLVNTACSLASLAIVTCITKEGVVQSGSFSNYKITQVLKMLVMGIIVSSLVNLLVWPVSARENLRQSLMKTTDAFGELLTILSVSFLSGSEEDLNHPAVAAASDRFKSVFSSLSKHLAEAKYEHYLLGTERQYFVEQRLVECVQRLAQDMGGLRSAAATQISLLSESGIHRVANGVETLQTATGSAPEAEDSASISSSPNSQKRLIGPDDALSLNEVQIQTVSSLSHSNVKASLVRKLSAQTPSNIFDTFIMYLGPPMRSMAWTMKEVLKSLPFAQAPDRNHGVLPKFRSSLTEAIQLFNKSRKEALEMVYKSKEVTQAHSLQVAADFEEVAASCGHFSSSLEDFAETCLQYLNILDELDLEVSERPNGRTWRWVLFWKRGPEGLGRYTPSPKLSSYERELTRYLQAQPTVNGHEEGALTNAPTTLGNEKSLPATLGFPYWIYPHLRIFRREDVKFAIKVGGGATLYAMFAFIPATEAHFHHWHLEWSLVSYMLICSMSIGASNTTAWSRSYGTLFGALIGIIVWLICNENGYALAFCGWVVSFGCFYFMIAKGQGPMARFILLTYNLSVLYSYALTIEDPDTDKDEDGAGINPRIFDIAFHRFIAVLLGVLGGLVVTYYIWPVSARQKVKTGLSLLWLRMGLIWKRAPLRILIDGKEAVPAYMDIRTETNLREYVDILDSLRQSAQSEFKLRGPFPSDSFDVLIQSTSRMLDSFHALNVVITKDLKVSPAALEILKYTATERDELALRICHLLSVLASSLNMEYPLNDALPSTTHVRDRLLGKLFEFRQNDGKKTRPTDEDYEAQYCYGTLYVFHEASTGLATLLRDSAGLSREYAWANEDVVLSTASIAREIEICGKELEKLYSTLGEKVLKLE